MSKLLRLLLPLLCLSYLAASAQKRTARKRISPVFHCLPPIPPVVAMEEDKTDPLPAGSKTQPVCTETRALNRREVCEGYPWLSADGLRVYFSSNRDGGHGNIYFAERTTIAEPFGEPKKVFKTEENELYAASLTSDELTMILTKQGYKLHIATRKSREEPFGTPKPLPGLEERKMYGPGISADGSELVAIDYSASDIINKESRTDKSSVWFVRDAKGRYVQKGILPVPEAKLAGPGQISKDGLFYYCSFKEQAGGQSTLQCFSRSKPGEPFVYDHAMENCSWRKNTLQPSVNGDGSLIIFTMNDDGMWSGNDLGIMPLKPQPEEERDLPLLVVAQRFPLTQTLPPALTVPVKTALDHKAVLPVIAAALPALPAKTIAVTAPASATVKLYPNPFNGVLAVQLYSKTNGSEVLELFNSKGEKTLSRRLTGSQTLIGTQNIPAGIYQVRIAGTQGVLYSGTVVSGN